MTTIINQIIDVINNFYKNKLYVQNKTSNAVINEKPLNQIKPFRFSKQVLKKGPKSAKYVFKWFNMLYKRK